MTKMEKTAILVTIGGVLLEILFCFLSILSVFGTTDKTIGTTFLIVSLIVGIIGIGTIASGIYFLRVSNYG